MSKQLSRETYVSFYVEWNSDGRRKKVLFHNQDSAMAMYNEKLEAGKKPKIYQLVVVETLTEIDAKEIA